MNSKSCYFKKKNFLHFSLKKDTVFLNFELPDKTVSRSLPCLNDVSDWPFISIEDIEKYVDYHCLYIDSENDLNCDCMINFKFKLTFDNQEVFTVFDNERRSYLAAINDQNNNQKILFPIKPVMTFKIYKKSNFFKNYII
jgi:hypothetical protein